MISATFFTLIEGIIEVSVLLSFHCEPSKFDLDHLEVVTESSDYILLNKNEQQHTVPMIFLTQKLYKLMIPKVYNN